MFLAPLALFCSACGTSVRATSKIRQRLQRPPHGADGSRVMTDDRALRPRRRRPRPRHEHRATGSAGRSSSRSSVAALMVLGIAGLVGRRRCSATTTAIRPAPDSARRSNVDGAGNALPRRPPATEPEPADAQDPASDEPGRAAEDDGRPRRAPRHQRPSSRPAATTASRATTSGDEPTLTTAVAVADIEPPDEGDLPEPGDEPVELPVQVTTPAPPSTYRAGPVRRPRARCSRRTGRMGRGRAGALTTSCSTNGERGRRGVRDRRCRDGRRGAGALLRRRAPRARGADEIADRRGSAPRARGFVSVAGSRVRRRRRPASRARRRCPARSSPGSGRRQRRRAHDEPGRCVVSRASWRPTASS